MSASLPPNPHPTTARRSTLAPTSSSSSAAYSSASHSQSQQSQNRQRQYAHLNAQLAQLQAHLADTQNLLRMTAVQAENVRGLGGWMGGLFMASSRVLGEEVERGAVNVNANAGVGAGGNAAVEKRRETAEGQGG